jgi:aminopeptidase N
MYVCCRKYSNAEENDLWKAMSKATESDPILKDLSVVNFMNSWTRQAGYPVVKVNRNYDRGLLEIEQVYLEFCVSQILKAPSTSLHRVPQLQTYFFSFSYPSPTEWGR